jgi:hypothetical protein
VLCDVLGAGTGVPHGGRAAPLVAEGAELSRRNLTVRNPVALVHRRHPVPVVAAFVVAFWAGTSALAYVVLRLVAWAGLIAFGIVRRFV